MQQQQSAVITVFLLGALAGCQRSTAPDLAIGRTVLISGGGGAIAQCNNVQLNVTDGSGNPVSADSVRWSSSDSVVASVTAGGLVRALQPSPGVTIRVVVYHDKTQGSAQTVFSIVGLFPGSCPAP